jgi:hypothetical protein
MPAFVSIHIHLNKLTLLGEAFDYRDLYIAFDFNVYEDDERNQTSTSSIMKGMQIFVVCDIQTFTDLGYPQLTIESFQFNDLFKYKTPISPYFINYLNEKVVVFVISEVGSDRNVGKASLNLSTLLTNLNGIQDSNLKVFEGGRSSFLSI